MPSGGTESSDSRCNSANSAANSAKLTATTVTLPTTGGTVSGHRAKATQSTAAAATITT